MGKSATDHPATSAGSTAGERHNEGLAAWVFRSMPVGSSPVTEASLRAQLYALALQIERHLSSERAS